MIQKHQHTAACSGPESCPELRALLSATPEEHAAWIQGDDARIALLRKASSYARFRASEAGDDPPNPYAPRVLRTEADRKAARTHELELEYAEAARHPGLRVASDAELSEFEPPSGYAPKEKR